MGLYVPKGALGSALLTLWRSYPHKLVGPQLESECLNLRRAGRKLFLRGEKVKQPGEGKTRRAAGSSAARLPVPPGHNVPLVLLLGSLLSAHSRSPLRPGLVPRPHRDMIPLGLAEGFSPILGHVPGCMAQSTRCILWGSSVLLVLSKRTFLGMHRDKKLH